MKNIFVIVSIAFTSFVFGQDVAFDKKNFENDKDGFKEAKAQIKEGDKIYEQGPLYYKDAIPFYLKANAFNPNSSEMNYKLGVCYFSSVEKYEALPYLKKATKLNPNIDPTAYFYLGSAYHIDMQWDNAITAYSKYQKVAQTSQDPNVIKDLTMRISQCYNGRKIVSKPIRVFIDNLGPNINTIYNEYGAVITADESVIVFTARRPDSEGGRIDPGLNEHFEDIYIAERDENNNWLPAVNVGGPVNTPNHDSNSGISADGQKFLIYLGKKQNGDIYESLLEGADWSNPEPVKEINTDYHESSACYSPDGKKIYYVSDKPGGEGDHDIYVTEINEKGKWGKPMNLGSVINTQYDEEGVFMHPDGKTLYFSSKGHTSIGGHDIFKTIWNEDLKSWSKPENLGYPVNTPGNDVFFVLSASGRHGYYTSINKECIGLRDLFLITFLGPEKLMVLNNEDNLIASAVAPVREVVIAPKIEVKEAQLTILKGVITDEFTGDVLQAEIEIVDNATGQIIATFKSNSSTGKYLVSLPAGKNYGIAVKKEEYLFHSENFDIPKTAAFQEVEKNIALKKLAVGSKIVLRNIFFDLNKATLRPESTTELNRLIKLMADVPSLKIELGGHTDSRGSDSYNQELSEKRAAAVVVYLTGAGIAANRLESAGYGETELVNDCSNGVSCSDEQHQENRRTEFKVLEL